MQKNELKIVGYCGENSHIDEVKSFCEDHDIILDLLLKTEKVSPILQLHELLAKTTENPLLLILDLDDVLISPSLTDIVEKFDRLGKSVIFSASPYFRFDHPELHYFYWKHYPRHDSSYNYLDASAFAGKKNDLLKLLSAISEKYPECIKREGSTLTYLISRYYADVENGCFESEVRISLDRQNMLFTSTRLSVSAGSRKKSWMYNLLYSKNERRIFEGANLTGALKHTLNVSSDKKGFFNSFSKSRPLIVSLATDQTGKVEYYGRKDVSLTAEEKFRAFSLGLKAHLETLRALVLIRKINKWNTKADRIFRFVPNKNKELNDATEKIIARLEQQLPVSFAHYNDGELTFIRDFLNERDHEKWFGRKQQQYNPLLAERLHEAMRFRKDGYFVGVPCSVHHPSLRKLADEVVGDYEYKVPAMTIHHNLAYMPRLLYSLRDREVFFFTNEYQDLSFFENLGVEVHPEKVTKVPFRNSYLEYDRYKEMAFPKGAVVVLTCGMLAKILTKVWYDKNDDLSVLALGSSLDDHIQKENIEYKLYPEDLPLTKNIYKSRAFLFGYKKTCRECFCY